MDAILVVDPDRRLALGGERDLETRRAQRELLTEETGELIEAGDLERLPK